MRKLVFLTTFIVTFSILYNLPKTSTTDPYCTLYKRTASILDNGQHSLLKPMTIFGNEKENRSFLPHFFAKNVWMASTWEIYYILFQRSICAYYFKFLFSPIAPNIFNYKRAWQNISIHDLIAQPPDCYCHNCSPIGHYRDLSIINNENIHKIIANYPKYREPQSINWEYNFKLLMDSMEDCVRKLKNDKKRRLMDCVRK